jgi:hypothetical protein
MTAINPARLKIQCADLCGYFSDPEKFISGLHDLLGFYAAHIRQTSLARTPLTLRTYQVPAPILWALINELEDLLNEDPDTSLKLIDALWEVEWIEFRQLAIICLGKVPPLKPENILNRIKSWLESSSAESIRRKVMTRGLVRLGKDNPKVVFDFFADLVISGSKKNHQAALFGLGAFAADQDFDNLPVIYKLLAEILLAEDTGLVKEITALLRTLRKRSEQETAYFLERQIAAAAKPRIFRVTRQVIGQFNPEIQVHLRNILKNFV